MFKKAYPIWIKDLTFEKNIQARFVAEFTARKNMILSITGATFYKVTFNGKLIHYGPAPTATGYARVDKLVLDAVQGDVCTLDVEVAGYNIDSYASVNQQSFIIAEVVAENEIVAATGYDFSSYRVISRIREVVKYSTQRHYSEVWDLSLPDEPYEFEKLDLSLTYLERKAPLPSLDNEVLCSTCFRGKFSYYPKSDEEFEADGQGYLKRCMQRSGFSEEEIHHRPMAEFLSMKYEFAKSVEVLPLCLSKGEYAVFQFSKNSSALINLKYSVTNGARVILVFDESIEKCKFALKLEISNAIEITARDEVDFSNFEISGFSYFGIFVVEGNINLREVSRTLVRNTLASIPRLNTDDHRLLSVYEAALESFRCNSLAIFTDCPSRERAGWLCDSYFISRVAYALTGNTFIEDDFLENYKNHSCQTIPAGMVPMCYPADHLAGRFIPQWAMWLVLELLEYKSRCKYADMAKFRNMTYGLVNFFEKYENDFMLLEDLPSWNFVEWSRANEWCEGVNFPTNMLYSQFLCAVSALYGDNRLKLKAEKIRETIKEMSFDGKFFRDQAIRTSNNTLEVNSNISEVCQYYAFYFGVADEEKYADLKERLIKQFGPESTYYPNIEKANALMGIYLRIDLLVKWGCKELCLEEIIDYFFHMAELTGTLWEHKSIAASLNHGFPSYIADVLLKLIND